MTGVVLIHGFTGSPASFGELARGLAARRPRLRSYVPTLIGHGGPVQGQPERFEQEVDRLAREIGSARLAGSHLCGYSLGARVALGLLARHGYLFSGATLIGVHPGLSSLAERAARVGSDERWCELLSRGGLHDFLAAWEAQPIFQTQRELAPARTTAQRHIRAAHDAGGLMRALRVLGLGQMPDYRGVFFASRVPLRLMVGARDEKFATLARELARAVPRVALDLVEGVGHNVLLEAPEHVQDVLMRALAE